MNNVHRDAALRWLNSGYSVIPILANGTKRPQLKWEAYQHRKPLVGEVHTWWTTSPDSGIGIVCGRVSGNLEMLELEGRAASSEHLGRIEYECEKLGVLDVWNQLTENLVASSPSGGIHLIYRIHGIVPGNTKVARRPATAEELAENPGDRIKVLSETRGEGGYFVAAPTGGAVHKSGDAWTLLSGQVGDTPILISRQDRDLIIQAVHAALDEMPQPVEPTAPVKAPNAFEDGSTAPGADFNNRESYPSLLKDYGWTFHSQHGGEQWWTRPGKRAVDGHSATLYYQGSDNLYVFSSGTELPTETPISKFAFYAFMEHRGDFSAAAKALYAKGYGERREVLDISDWFATGEDEVPRVGAVVEAQAEGLAAPASGASKTLKVHEWTETGVGELLARVYGDRFRAVSDQKFWRYYDKGLWVKDQERRVESAAKRVTRHLLEQASAMIDEAMMAEDESQIKIASAVYRKAESFRSDRGAKACVSRFGAEPNITVPFAAFDTNVDLLRFTNGTLDLSTMVLREHRPGDMITLDIPYAYDPDATAPLFRKFLNESIPDEDTRGYLKRVAGYTASGRPTEGVWFALFGETGSGKSTFLRIMNPALGDHARTAAQATFAQRNEGSRAANDLNDIRTARMVMISETKEGQLFNESLIKQYSGGDEMNSHGLYQENGTWQNRGVLFMATNHPPRLSADDNANWRRVKMIEFPVSRYTNPELTPDPRLAEKIIESELPGVMNWIIEGLLEYRDGGLNEPKLVTEAVRGHRTEVDPVTQFLTEGSQDGYIATGDDLEISAAQLYRIFVNWCEDNGLRALGAQRFGMRLTALRYDIRRGGQGARIRVGIGQGTRGVLGSMDWRNK